MIRLVDRARGNALARANALANALALARDVASALDNAEVLVGTLARANALARALTNASALNFDHTLDLDSALMHSHALARALAYASDPDFARDRDPGSTRDLAREFAHALVRDLVDLDPVAHWARALVAVGARSMPGRVPRGLVALAVRLLPVAQRPRYREEFRVELVELRRRERLGYSLRVLGSAWELRRALVEAVCTPDGATARRVER